MPRRATTRKPTRRPSRRSILDELTADESRTVFHRLLDEHRDTAARTRLPSCTASSRRI